MKSVPSPDSPRAVARTHISLTDVWPDLLLSVPEMDRSLARRVLAPPLLRAENEDLARLITAHPGTICFAVVEGAVLKETQLMGQTACELLGPDDLLVPPLSAARQTDQRSVSRYLAHGKVSLAPIDRAFRQASRRWPELADLLHDRLAQQTHRASTNLAMLHLSRAEDRLVALFTELADRFGRVQGTTVHVEIALTHTELGRLIGSSRPTVSLALGGLAEDHRVERLADGSWQLDLGLVTL